MRKFIISSRVTELNLKRRELISHLSDLRKNLIYKNAPERKKRSYFKKHKEIQDEINSIDKQIDEERERFLKQKEDQMVDMFRTPPKSTLGTSNITPEPYVEDIVEDVPNLARATQPNIAEPNDEPINLFPTTNVQTTAPATVTTGAISKDVNTLPSYESLKQRDMEEKVEKLQRELKETKDYYANMFKNNVLVPTNNTHPKNIQNVRRNLNFETFELKKPVPRNRSELPKRDTLSIINELSKPHARTSIENPHVTLNMPFTANKPIENPIPNFENIQINTQTTENEPFQQNISSQNEFENQKSQPDLPRQANIFRNDFEQSLHPQAHTPQGNFEQEAHVPRNVHAQQARALQDDFEQEMHAPQIIPVQQAALPQNNLLQQGQMFSPNINRVNNRHANEDEANVRPRSSFIRRLKLIPKVNGESYNELRDFIDVVDTLYISIQSNSEEMEFYDQLLLQIRGEARNAIETLERTEWQAIREKLKSYFSYLANKDIINSKLENLKQEKDENLNQFIDRTRKLLQEKNSIYGNLSHEQKNEHNKMARRAFARGVRDIKLRERLQIHGANTLEDAIAYSIETENYITNQITDREMYCGYCKNTGHRERNCFRKEQGSGPVNNLISALRSINARPIGNRNANSGFGFNSRNNNWNQNFIRNPNSNRNWNNGGLKDNGFNFNRGFDRNSNNSRTWNNNRSWNDDRNNDRNTNTNWNNGNRNNRSSFPRDNFGNNNVNEPNKQVTQRNDAQNPMNNKRRENNRNSFSNFPIQTAVTVKNAQSNVSTESTTPTSEN